jgi:hypothetical protein
VKQQIQGDGRPDNFRHVASGNCNLGHEPETDAGPAARRLPAHLRQIAFGGDAQLEAEALEQDRHQV